MNRFVGLIVTAALLAMPVSAYALTLKKGETLGSDGRIKGGKDEAGKVTKYKGEFELPDKLNYQPNDATLWYYYNKVIGRRYDPRTQLRVNPAPSPRQISSKLQTNSFLDEQLKTTTLLSYIFYDGTQIIYDALPPEKRFPKALSNDAFFVSHSMGKSLTSYLIGHVICQGYIESIDEPIRDWPLMQNTLYFDQPLINLLNMTAGDTSVIEIYGIRYIKTDRHIHNISLKLAVENEGELKNSKPSKNPKWAYSNLTTDVLTSYLMHRVGENYENFLTTILQSKIGIERPVYFSFSPTISWASNPPMRDRISQGAGEYSYIASRYDFLRIAIAMVEDWQQDTCEGKYLKELYDRRIKTGRTANWRIRVKPGATNKYGDFTAASKGYGGQFWTDFKGLEDRPILLMGGYNGQQIAMDMDNGRIVVMHAAKSRHYNTKRLGFHAIKHGALR